MNYFPYFRGKQYELICLRENAELISDNGFTPIIEPVKESLDGFLRALEVLKRDGAGFLVMANPSVGHHAKALAKQAIHDVRESLDEYEPGGWIFQVESEQDLVGLRQWIKKDNACAILHSGAIGHRQVSEALAGYDFPDRIHVFGASCTTRYRAAFESTAKVILEDGFKKRKNSEYPPVELFSELPITYRERGATGFGDYLIVGSEYSEGGGAAYAVAIHLTYADDEDGGAIYVRHFISDSNDSTRDPAGKFREALAKLVRHCRSKDSKIPQTKALDEYFKLHQSGHFPGLGYVKKLSMQHHLEMYGE